LQLLQIINFKISASGTGFENTGFLPAPAKLAVKYRPGRWNTGHVATLLTSQELLYKCFLQLIALSYATHEHLQGVPELTHHADFYENTY